MKTDRFIGGLKKFYRDESGITGLETAIILIAFIVVAAVFAFTIMTTGLFSTEKAKTTAQAGISEASSTFAMKGSVTGEGLPVGNPTHVSAIRFQVTLAAGAEDVDITLNRLAFSYTDDNNSQSVAGGTGLGGIMTDVIRTTITGTDDNLLTSGEVVQFRVVLDGAVANPLVANRKFRIEIIPSMGGSLILERRTPVALKAVMNLN